MSPSAPAQAPIPEVMIPLVGTAREFELMKAVVDKAAEAVFAETGTRVEYLVGTMIELPRAALRAGDIAAQAEFFSFGTNDLTQTTLGVSRDDAARFLGEYVEQGIYAKDPFVSIDVEGVGELVQLAAERGRAVAPRPEARHLRRTRRRPGQHRLLRAGRPRLRQRQPLPRPDRAAGGGTSGTGDRLTASPPRVT